MNVSEQGQEEFRSVIEGLLVAINGFRWLGNNLHNIRCAPEQFETFFRAALEDAEAAWAVAEAFAAKKVL